MLTYIFYLLLFLLLCSLLLAALLLHRAYVPLPTLVQSERGGGLQGRERSLPAHTGTSMVLHSAPLYLGMSYELAKPVKVEQSSHSL